MIEAFLAMISLVCAIYIALVIEIEWHKKDKNDLR